jgi:hypothetical protein
MIEYPINKGKHQDVFYPPNAKEYKRTVFKDTSLRGAEDFYRTSDFRIISAIALLVERDGPIHKNVVKRRLANVFKTRLGSQIDIRLESLIRQAFESGYVNKIGDFLWPSKMENVEIRLQKGKNKRPIHEIPPQEIDKGIFETIRNSISITEEDLIKEVARIFGFRATRNVRIIISSRIIFLQNENRIIEVRGKLVCQR